MEQPYEISSARQPHMQAVSISAHRGRHRSVALCRRAVEGCLPLERMPLACTLGLPLNLHVRQSVSLQGPVDLDHHRVEFLVAHQQWFFMIVHIFTVHPCAVRLVQSKLDLLITGHLWGGGGGYTPYPPTLSTRTEPVLFDNRLCKPHNTPFAPHRISCFYNSQYLILYLAFFWDSPRPQPPHTLWALLGFAARLGN